MVEQQDETYASRIEARACVFLTLTSVTGAYLTVFYPEGPVLFPDRAGWADFPEHGSAPFFVAARTTSSRYCYTRNPYVFIMKDRDSEVQVHVIERKKYTMVNSSQIDLD